MFDSSGHPAPRRYIARTAPEDLSTEHLEHEIEVRAARMNAGMCDWLELIAELDRRQAWGSWGCLSCAHWVAWRCAVSLRSAREHVRVARRLDELPAIHAEFAEGRLSYSKVRALTRVATPESEPDLIELGRHATASQLDVLVRAYSRASAEEAREVHANRFVAWSWEPDGSLSVQANLPADDGATVIAAIEAAAERLRDEREAWSESDECQGGSAEPPTPAEDGSAEPLGGVVSRAEALVSIASDSLAAANRPENGSPKPADRNMVVVHVDADELVVEKGGRCHIREGSGLPLETARRVACDASVVTMLERDGEPLSVGRRTRSVPPAMRRAVEARDQGCRFPGCHHKRYVDAHHIHHWASGGETSAGNLLMLCRRHHRLLHEGGYSISGEPGRDGALAFHRPDGTVIAASPLPPVLSKPSSQGPSDYEAREGPLRIGTGARMDLGCCVDAMFSIMQRAGTAPAAPG